MIGGKKKINAQIVWKRNFLNWPEIVRKPRTFFLYMNAAAWCRLFGNKNFNKFRVNFCMGKYIERVTEKKNRTKSLKSKNLQ